VLVPLAEFRQRMRDQAAPIAALETARIDDPALDVPAVCEHVWQVIENLGIPIPGRRLPLPGLPPAGARATRGAILAIRTR
jgi:hypothetical protein